MDSDRQLQIEFRQALDEVLPPAPWLETAVAADLRGRRPTRHSDRTPRKPRLTSAMLPRPVAQLAAGLVMVILASVGVITFITLRSPAHVSTPAGSDSAAYQAIVSRDLDRVDSAGNGVDCTSLQSTCPAPGRPVQVAYQRWLADLKGFDPPVKFAVVDAQMRIHLIAAISDLNTVFAAYRAHDKYGLDNANFELQRQGEWLDVVASSIVEWRQGTFAAYTASVRTEGQDIAACEDCQSLAGTSEANCAVIQSAFCEGNVAYAKSAIEDFEAALFRVAAPGQLGDQDAGLQRHLAQADTGVLMMAGAQLSGDQAGFSMGRQSFKVAMPAIESDVTAILGTPAGDLVPAQLLGDWLMPAAAAQTIAGGACPTPLAVSTCMFRLTFTATTYSWTVNVTGFSGGGGDVVANGAEMDFFNGQQCGYRPPDGIGRYSWVLKDGALRFTSLNSDPCPRFPFLAGQTYTRTG